MAFVGGQVVGTKVGRGTAVCSKRAVGAVKARSARVVVKMATDYNALGSEFEAADADPVEIMDRALTDFGGDVAIAFSGAEDVALVEYAHQTKKPYRVFALDTGRLHPETYRFFAQVEQHYGIRIEYVFPNGQEVEDLVNEKGLFSFYEDGHQECCRVRKVRPLRKKLGTLKAWITGQRKDQSPTRAEVPMVQVDPAFKAVGDGELIKFNPLSNVSSAEIWALIRMLEVPYNALHEKGFVSIGCEPCTKPVLPNQHEREGRWWWEEATQKECGLHKGNLSTDAAQVEEAANFVGDLVTKNPVMVFTKTGCPYCAEVKELFKTLKIEYTEEVVDALDNSDNVMKALLDTTAQKTLPNVFIGRKHIGGAAETKKMHEAGLLLPAIEKLQAAAV